MEEGRKEGRKIGGGRRKERRKGRKGRGGTRNDMRAEETVKEEEERQREGKE